MEYPRELIAAYAKKEISRAQFERLFAKKQGFNNEVESYANESGIYAFYRGRKAQVKNNLLTWQETNGQNYSAQSFKELKIKIDILELKAAA